MEVVVVVAGVRLLEGAIAKRGSKLAGVLEHRPEATALPSGEKLKLSSSLASLVCFLVVKSYRIFVLSGKLRTAFVPAGSQLMVWTSL